MKFKSILKKIIKEDKRINYLLDNVINVTNKPSSGKQQKISLADFKQLMKTDPTTVAPAGFDWDNAGMMRNQDGKRVPKDTDKIKEDFKDVITGQYVNWLLRTFLKPNTDDFVSDYEKGTPEYDKQFRHHQEEIFEDEDMISGLLSKFHKFQKRIAEDKRNIMNVKGIQELMNLPVRATAGGETVRLIEFEGRLVSKAIAKDESLSSDSPQVRFFYPGSEILKVGSDYTLIKIPAGGELGQKAASHFGGYYLGSSSPSSNETNWCTSPENSSNFRSYIQQAPLYIILANDDKGQVGIKSGLPKERYQIHFGNYRQFKDRLNGNFDFIKELAGGKFTEFKDFFKDEFKKGVGSSSFSTSTGNLQGEYIVKLNNPNPTATSDYIKIYGKEGIPKSNPDLMLKQEIENIPTSCTALTIKNDTKENLFVDIPDDILKFTGLKTINITNIAKSLPSDFSPLKQLRFVSIVNNPELTKLPDGFDECPSLVFINLLGSDNIVLSPKQLEYLEQDRDEYGKIEEPYFWTPK
jgi:hypothetical protein